MATERPQLGERPGPERFVDSHVHYWQIGAKGLDWPMLAPDFRYPLHRFDRGGHYDAADHRDETAGVNITKVVHVQAAEADDPADETAWLQQMSEADPLGWPNAIVGAANLCAPDAVALLERHLAHANFRGVRDVTLNDHLDDPALEPALRVMAEHGVVSDTMTRLPGFDKLVALAQRHPDVTFILGHAGHPVERSEEFLTAWRAGLQVFKQQPNIFCKLSGFGLGDNDWTVDSMRPMVLDCIDAFGVDRCLFSSNWPVDKLYSTYGEMIAAYDLITADFSAAERDTLFAGTAEGAVSHLTTTTLATGTTRWLPNHLVPNSSTRRRGRRRWSPAASALITGGAGAVGAASARALAAHGADVVVADIDADRVAATVADVEAAGRKAIGVVSDLTEDGAIEAAVARADEAFGRVDILVNALGHHLSLAGPFEDSTEAGWDKLYRVNLLATFRACHAVVPGMRERKWGRIVNFSSVEGIRSMPHAAVYTAFKGGIDSFTKSLGVEVAGSGIRVNAIAVDKTRAYQVNFYNLGEEYERHIPVWVPAGRYAEGDDVAGVVLFLSSELCFWVVGQTIPADGGTLAAGGWYRTPVKWTNSPLLHQYFEDDPSINAARPRGVQ